jgi:hypothetical protein
MVRGSPRNRQLDDDSGSNIDILVVWTTAAECSTSDLPVPCLLTATTRFNMLSVVKLAISQTNTAFAESGIRTQLRMVHAYRDSTYVETPATRYVKELEHLRTVDDQKLDSVHEKRALYGADIVVMIAGTLLLLNVVPLRYTLLIHFPAVALRYEPVGLWIGVCWRRQRLHVFHHWLRLHVWNFLVCQWNR